MQSLLFDDICSVINQKLNIKVYTYEYINRGYLNEKWTLYTNQGQLFVKSYHPDRYRNHLSTIWQEVDQALRLQMRFYNSGGSCPMLFSNEENGYLFETPTGRKFVLMEHCPGKIVRAGEVNELQMYSLGLAAAEMHNSWNLDNDGMLQKNGEPVWRLDIAEMMGTWNRRWEEARTSSPLIRNALQLQKEILDQINVDEYKSFASGWTHLDLWVDNLLFSSDELTAIVDFDRVRYSYPILDIGRAILSCTLDAGRFRPDAASAFAEGYRKFREIPKGYLLNAIRYSWMVESFWWLRPRMESYSVAPKRFAEEMLWTASGWDFLEKELGDI
jgi:homoserine kinase type II